MILEKARLDCTCKDRYCDTPTAWTVTPSLMGKTMLRVGKRSKARMTAYYMPQVPQYKDKKKKSPFVCCSVTASQFGFSLSSVFRGAWLGSALIPLSFLGIDVVVITLSAVCMETV